MNSQEPTSGLLQHLMDVLQAFKIECWAVMDSVHSQLDRTGIHLGSESLQKPGNIVLLTSFRVERLVHPLINTWDPDWYTWEKGKCVSLPYIHSLPSNATSCFTLNHLISWWDKTYSWRISKKSSFLLTWYLSTYFITQNKKRVKAWTKRKIKSVFLFLYEAFINKHCHINYFIKYDTLHCCALWTIVLNLLSRWFSLLGLFLILIGRKY